MLRRFGMAAVVLLVLAQQGDATTVHAANEMFGDGSDGAVVFSDGDALLRVSAAGGEPAEVLLAAERDERRYRWPVHLSGGRAPLFLVYRGVREADHEIAVMSLDTGERR